MADELILLDFWASPFGIRVRIALAEKGIQYEAREEDLWNKSSLLLHMNPVHKKIPVLIHNGTPISESLTIVQYIDEAWSHASPLLPSHPYERARARFWADYIDKKIYPLGRSILVSTGEAQERAKKGMRECFRVLEGELGEKSYFGGDMFGLVDVALIPFYSRFYTFETYGKLSISDEFPKLVGWAKRCVQRESVSQSLPDQYRVFDFLSEIRPKLEPPQQ